jgi:gliding motility-associated-like protein
VIIPVIHSNPAVSFNVQPSVLCEDMPAYFTGTASSDAITWVWDFGNGAGNNVPPFSMIYNDPYTGPVNVKVFTAEGCGSVVDVKPVQVKKAPQVNAGPDLFIKTGEAKTIAASVSPSGNYSFLWTPSTNLNDATVLNPVTNTTVQTEYKLTVTDQATGCTGKDSMVVKTYSGLFVPNAFSPNADGKNDVWGIPALEAYPDCIVSIYNRYGQKIFESKGYHRPWDGRFKGIMQQMDTYVYIINTGDRTLPDIRGTVLLLR